MVAGHNYLRVFSELPLQSIGAHIDEFANVHCARANGVIACVSRPSAGDFWHTCTYTSVFIGSKAIMREYKNRNIVENRDICLDIVDEENRYRPSLSGKML